MSIFHRVNSLKSSKPKTPSHKQSASNTQLSSYQKPHVSISEENEEFLTSPSLFKPKRFVSNLTDHSLKELQHKEGYASPLSLKSNEISVNALRKRAQTSSSQLRLSTEMAEYHDDYYLGGKHKYQIGNNANYKAFQQKYQKNCFDKEGHLLYQNNNNANLLNPNNNNARERLKSDDSLTKSKIINAKQEEKKFLKNIESKIKKTNNETFLVSIMRDFGKVEFQKFEHKEKSSLCVDESRGKFLEAIKNRSISSLQEIIKSGKNVQNFASAQVEIERNYLEMKKVLEETSIDHKRMTDIFLKQERAFIEIQLENDHLLRKNQLLNGELNELRAKMEALTENYSKLSKFESSYLLVMEKFPNQSLEKLLDKLEYLEKAGMDFTKKIGELEDEKLLIEREKQSLIQKYEQKYMEMNKREGEAERKMLLAKDQLGVKSELIQEANRYRDNYFLLFKHIIALFTEWNDEIRIYFNPDLKQKISEPQATLDDPIEILNLLKKMVRISTPESLQKYLRRIIVSANQLQRDFFPGAANEKFDPDKIYERVYKMMKKLVKENEKLKGVGVEKGGINGIKGKRESLVRTKMKSLSEMKNPTPNSIEKTNEEMFWN